MKSSSSANEDTMSKATTEVSKAAANARIAALTAELAAIEDKAFTGDVAAMAKDPDNRFRLREEIRRRVEKVVINFGALEDMPTSEPSFEVTLTDGSSYVLGLEEYPHYWDKNGKHWRVEHGPAE